MLTSFLWKQIIQIEPLVYMVYFSINIPCMPHSSPAYNFIGIIVLTMCNNSFHCSWLFASIMPQVLQELFDCPVSTIDKSYLNRIANYHSLLTGSRYTSCIVLNLS